MGINLEAIRSSYEVLKPIVKDVADRFYQNLFRDYPAAKELLNSVDLKNQKNALIRSLSTAVENLDNPDDLTRFLLALRESHVRFGAEAIHYDWVGATLLKTFGEFLGAQWTDELRIQWATVYNILSEAIQSGAKSPAKRGPKLRAVQRDEHQKEISVNHEEKTASEFAVDLASGLELPVALRTQIKRSVEATVLALVKAEVNRHFAQELQRIEKLSPEELVRMTS